jgi:microcompartment protein CcmL/EutN
MASLVQTTVAKKAPTGNRRGRPTASEVIARTNHKVDQFFQKKTAQVDASMPLQPVEEEKQQQSQPAEV